LNKVTGDLAFLTNYRSLRDEEPNSEIVYETRGILILEYVKIRDESLSDKLYQSIEEYERKVFAKTMRGFNLVYGNILTATFKYT